MNWQEHKHICNLATDLLIDAKINSLPVDCEKVANLYTPFWRESRSLTYFQNVMSLSMRILPIFGLKSFVQYAELLGINLAAPPIVLRMIRVKSPEDIAELSNLPIFVAKEQFVEYRHRFSQKIPYISRPERKLEHQFRSWASQFAAKY